MVIFCAGWRARGTLVGLLQPRGEGSHQNVLTEPDQEFVWLGAATTDGEVFPTRREAA